MKMFVDIGVHKQLIVVCAVNQARQVVARQRSHSRDVERIIAWFAKRVGSAVRTVRGVGRSNWRVRGAGPTRLASRSAMIHNARRAGTA